MAPNKNLIKILLVDDHPLVREGIKSSLTSKEDLKVIGEASNGKETLKLIAKLNPDVILLDISMPDMSGVDIMKSISAKKTRARVIVLSMHDNKDLILEMIRLGAYGYVLKDSKPKELINAIHAVYNNENYYSPQIIKIILNDLTRQIKKTNVINSESKITPREKEVLLHIADGYSNKEIAKKLSVSTRTIETHRERIMKKLGIHNIAGLTKYAISEGILKL